MSVTITEQGSRAAGERLEGIAHRALDARPALREIVGILRRGEEAQFGSRGARSGEPWPQLADATRRIKARKHQDPRPMRASGNLEASLTRQHPDAVLRIRRTGLLFSTRARGATFSQNRQAGDRQPRRVITAVTARDRLAIVDVVNDHLLGER